MVNKNTIGRINQGVLALIGVEKADTEADAERLLERIAEYRIFNDPQGRMNVSLRDIDGGLLLVPQFTLAASTQKGKRPSFSSAASPEDGRRLFDHLLSYARDNVPSRVQSGEFGADMQVELINDGPVTFWLQTKTSS